ALFPLTVTLADRLQSDISGDLPVSFAGGVSEYNAAELFSTGIRPVTCATELLKPSGYLRLAGIARRLDLDSSREAWRKETIDKKALSALKEKMTGSYLFTKDFRGTHRAAVENTLPLFDCAVAPCVEACPVGQHVPAYIRLAGEGRFDEALKCIYDTNPLPSVTGTICDHQCMTRCSRLDYEGAVRIRDMKRIAARRGEGYSPRPPERENGHTAAIIGAGPAGLSAAYFLRRAGFQVTVFEKEASAGGVVRQVLPYFRIAAELLDRDIARIEALGVTFRFNVGNQLTVESLKRDGFQYIFVGIGAWSSRELKIPGPCKVIDSLEFLRTFKENPESLSLGKTVAVVGGGNTAMDGARAALRSPGVEQVFILYRRTEDQMPADREEYDNALADGVVFRPLLTPESCPEEGSLLCRVMTLGKPGPDGRPQPVPSDQTVLLEVDTVIAAVGETVDTAALQALGLPTRNLLKDPATLETVTDRVYLGGDARTGP
ncbi:MAG: FAD-dependent oxidoreductase, partial [Deltaproteobacteria bacterium]|nr:FAD-dependent oxidoreductase [Candidatus Anaeroferrophillacea bacterium]